MKPTDWLSGRHYNYLTGLPCLTFVASMTLFDSLEPKVSFALALTSLYSGCFLQTTSTTSPKEHGYLHRIEGSRPACCNPSFWVQLILLGRVLIQKRLKALPCVHHDEVGRFRLCSHHHPGTVCWNIDRRPDAVMTSY